MTEVTLIKGDTRKPVAGHLTYRGHVEVDPHSPMGPTLFGTAPTLPSVTLAHEPAGRTPRPEHDAGGELVWPVTVEYTQAGPAATRVGFAYVGPNAPEAPSVLDAIASGTVDLGGF